MEMVGATAGETGERGRHENIYYFSTIRMCVVFLSSEFWCGRLPSSNSPEKCSLISSALAATQGQGSVDNQSILQLVNCPGCCLWARRVLSTSAGKDKSSLCLLSLLPTSPSAPAYSFAGVLSMNVQAVFMAQRVDCSYFTTPMWLPMSSL